MNILALDTSLKINTVSISIKTEKGIFSNEFHFTSKLLAEELLPSLNKCVQNAGISKTEIDTVVVPEGPGSFTGLRLAYSLAKALVLLLNVRLIRVPTMACLANSLSPFDGQVLIAVDARRHSIYGQVFEKAEAKSEVFDQDFLQAISSLEKKPSICLCSGYKSIMEGITKERQEDFSFIQFIEYKNIFSLDILNYFLSNEEYLLKSTEDDYVAPFYLRKSDAEK